MGHADLHAQLHDHFNNRRYDEIEAHLGTGFLYEDFARGLTMKSPGEFIDYLHAWTAAFSDATVGDVAYHEGADFSVATFHGRGLNDGPLEEGMAATNRRMDLPFCEVMEYGSDGRVIHGQLSYDQMTLLTQLGIVSPPGDEVAADPEDTVRALFELMDAQEFERMMGMMTDDIQGVDEISRGWMRGGDAAREYMEQISGFITDIRSRVSDLQTRITGDSALVTCWLEQDYLADGQEVHIAAPTTIVLRRHGADWRVALVHSVALGEE